MSKNDPEIAVSPTGGKEVGVSRSNLTYSTILTGLCIISWQPGITCAWDGESATDLSRAMIWNEVLSNEDSVNSATGKGAKDAADIGITSEAGTKESLTAAGYAQIKAGNSLEGEPHNWIGDQLWHQGAHFGLQQIELASPSHLGPRSSIDQVPGYLHNLGTIVPTVFGPQIHLSPVHTPIWAYQPLSLPQTPRLCQNIAGRTICP